MNPFFEELEWRGLLHNHTPGVEEQLNNGMQTAYVGFDPTADSLHVGSLIPVLLLKHLQNHGHKPIALVGGATGMIGDPSGKSAERSLLDEEQLQKNIDGIRAQLGKLLDFDEGKENAALLLNNYDWMKDYSFINFARDIGKHLTVNYMMAKDSVKNRLSPESGDGMSFTEFTYQLLQAYDFMYLHDKESCTIQMGGSDQWGNITSGTELVRRKLGKSAFAITAPLLTKADGSKFGKSEGGDNIWLDAQRTSPYAFYQFWLNQSDEDSEDFIKMFTFLDKSTIDDLIKEHKQAPHKRLLQSKLAKEITQWIHGEEATNGAVQASSILFGKISKDQLQQLDESVLNVLKNEIKLFTVSKRALDDFSLINLLTDFAPVYSSKGEARRALKQNAIAVNEVKVNEQFHMDEDQLLLNRYTFIKKGKKNFYIIEWQG